MQLSMLVIKAVKCYALSNGTDKILDNLQKIPEESLPDAILNLEKKPEGDALTLNLVSILVFAAKTLQSPQDAETTHAEVEKLRTPGTKALKKPGLIFYYKPANYTELKTSYLDFVGFACRYIDEHAIRGGEKFDLEQSVKTDHFQTPDEVSQLREKIKTLEASHEESKKTASEATAKLKSLEEKLHSSKQSPEAIQQIMQLLMTEIEFEKNYEYVLKIFTTWEDKSIQASAMDAHKQLTHIFTRYLTAKSDEKLESKAMLPNDENQEKMKGLIFKIGSYTKANYVTFFMSNKPEFAFCFSLRKILDALQPEKLMKLPQDVSLRDIEICREGAQLGLQQMMFTRKFQTV